MENNGTIRRNLVRLAWAVWLLLPAAAALGVDDGQGTNHVGVLRAAGIEMGGALRTAWPEERFSVGGTLDFRTYPNRPTWAPAFRWDGVLETARLQTDGGEAEVKIVRSRWNDSWDDHEEIHSLTATAAGVADSGWSSTWVSNGYRIGVIVTGHTTGTNLWWSIDYRR